MKNKNLLKKAIGSALVATMAMSMVACGSKTKTATNTTTDTTKEVVTLKAFTLGKAPTTGLDNFYKQLDALTVKDLGAKVRFDYIAWGDEKNKINLAIASGEYDLYSGGGFSDYKGTATKNAFLDLKPLLKDVPDLVEHYTQASDKTLSYAELSGKLFGIPQLGKVDGGDTGSEGLVYRKDLLKEWGLDEVTNLDTMEKYLYKAKDDARYKATPVITDNRIWTSLFYMIAGGKYMEISGISENPYAVVSYADPYTVVNFLDTPEYKKILEYASKWYKDGIINHDILAASANETAKSAELLKANKKVAETNSPRWSIETSIVAPIFKANPTWELGWFDYKDTNGSPAYLPGISNNSVISISAKSKNAATALKFIEKAHTDQTYYNLLKFGVLDENYKIVDGIPSTVGIDENSVKPSWTALPDGYMEKATLSADPKWEAITQKMKTGNPTPKEYSPLEGFSFDKTELSAESAALETVKTQYMLPLQCGVTKNIDTDLVNVKAKLKGAGLDKYMAALQKQLTDFAATR